MKKTRLERAEKIFWEDKNYNFLNKDKKSHTQKEFQCYTCKRELGSEIARILIMRDKDEGPRFFCFHFFFPCWDLNLLCQNYPNLVIHRVGFSIPEELRLKETSILNMKKNFDLWI